MAELPRLTDQDYVEREGLIHVAAIVNNARCIWRETLFRNIGVDGQIEYVTPEGLAPGRVVAVQVKSGASHFERVAGDDVLFTPEEKDRRYWAGFPASVVLVLHNPTTAETVWADARQASSVSGTDEAIRVPRSNQFDVTGVLDCLACDGPLPSGPFDPSSVVEAMAIPHRSAQSLCFLDLFAQGMTDLANSVYFHMDLVVEVLDVKSAVLDPPIWSVGASEFDFVNEYVDFLVRHDLARVDYASWAQKKQEHEITGRFVAPLTEKGRAVRDLVSTIDRQLPGGGGPHSRAIVERFVQMVYSSNGVDEFSIRQARIEDVRKEIEQRTVNREP